MSGDRLVFVVPFYEYSPAIPSTIAACFSVPEAVSVVAVDDCGDLIAVGDASKLPRWFPHLHYVPTVGTLGLERCRVEGVAAALTHNPSYVVVLEPGVRPSPDVGAWLPSVLVEPVVSRSFRQVHWWGLPARHARELVRSWQMPDCKRIAAGWSSPTGHKEPRGWVRMPAGDPPPEVEFHVKRGVGAHRRPPAEDA